MALLNKLNRPAAPSTWAVCQQGTCLVSWTRFRDWVPHAPLWISPDHANAPLGVGGGGMRSQATFTAALRSCNFSANLHMTRQYAKLMATQVPSIVPKSTLEALPSLPPSPFVQATPMSKQHGVLVSSIFAPWILAVHFATGHTVCHVRCLMLGFCDP